MRHALVITASVVAIWSCVAQPTLAQQSTTGAPPSAPAAVPPATAPERSPKDRLREEQRAYMGRNVRVHLTDGSTAVGRLIGETDQGLSLQPSPSDEPVLIPYERVESIAAGMPRWKKIAIGVGAASAAALVIGLN